MSWFSKFKYLFALKLNFNGGQFYKEMSKFGYFKKWKSQNIVGLTEEIGWESDKVLSKIGKAEKIKWSLVYQPFKKNYFLLFCEWITSTS